MVDLKQGQQLRRVDLHEQYGGRRQGGISPSKATPNVFIFTDPIKGKLHGYLYDGGREDGLFHYTGEGQAGDQQMIQGNRTIRDHIAEGRELHLFDAHAGQATYRGRVEYVDYYHADAPPTGGGSLRSVIVFRLRPVDFSPGPSLSKVDALGHERVKEVPVEQHLTETMLIAPNREPHEAERREQKLVRAYLAHLSAAGHEVCRLQLLPDGEPAPLFCDLYDKTDNTVIEAKGTVARPAFRMAVGQLADYSRLVNPTPARTILVPEKPRADLLSFAAAENITVVWQDGDTFTSADS